MTGKGPTAAQRWDPRYRFGTDDYRAINAARLDHLASLLAELRLGPAGMSVIELGAGIGDHSGFWLDRGARLTITEAREENLAILRERFPGADIRRYDVDADAPPAESFDIVYCYGLLYHLADPARGIAAIGALARRIALLETCVSRGDALDPHLLEENPLDPTQSFAGGACRPTRPWLFAELGKAFPHVYLPGSQPVHPQFPLDWRRRAEGNGLTRSIFVAAHERVEVPTLFERVLPRQVAAAPYRPPITRSLPPMLRALGIAAVIDAGAGFGEFALALRGGGFTGSIASFEPLRPAVAALSRVAADDVDWHVFGVALGAEDKAAVPLHVAADVRRSAFTPPGPRALAADPSRRRSCAAGSRCAVSTESGPSCRMRSAPGRYC